MGQYVIWMTNVLLLEIWVFLNKSRWSPSSSKLEGHMRSILGDFPFFMEQATCALIVFQIHLARLCTSITLAKRKKTPFKLCIICRRYWLLHIDNSWKHLPNQANANLTKMSYMLRVWGFYMLFWPSWLSAPPYTQYMPSMHVDFHLGGCKPIKILGGDTFQFTWALKG